jgi:nucleotide-binding universal stress UspA family protein
MSAQSERNSWNAVLTLERILVPTDFSEESKHAFGFATALAEEFDANITVLFVLEVAPFLSGMEGSPILVDPSVSSDLARRKLKAFIQAEIPKTVHVTPLLVKGNASSEIVRVAQENDIDLIVLSTRGHTVMQHLLLGSTAERVVRHAPCPVLVIRAKSKESTRLVPRTEIRQPTKRFVRTRLLKRKAA